MRKILIVGHPSSRYEGVERLLNDCGMGVAKPSRREGMTPSEVGTTLLQAHGVAPSQLVDEQNRIRRVEVGPLWNGLALDLMLSNLDQPLWGWSDPYSVSLLNYWSALDSKITFMLVYDDPGTALTRGNGANGKMSWELLGERVRDWCAYNA
ncbi:MAG: chromosome partitioning protein ParA, partial [Coriobacteriia bacterium]|nr:chromosome partitioning protein ParA [Coriobacteriia bacterium]